jgi:hypothetical protein
MSADKGINDSALNDREAGTYRLNAKITLNGACCSTIDVPGITLAGTTTGFTISGFEALADVALDTSRDGGVIWINHGTVSALQANGDYVCCNAFYPADFTTLSGTISGTAGSRIVTIDLNLGDAAAAVDLTADTITNATVDFVFPIKKKDF